MNSCGRRRIIIKEYRSIGILSSRTGAAGQINAIDEAVKRTNTEVLTIQLPRDTKGWGGHGNYIVLGAANEADAREAVEIALEYTERYSGELYISGEGHVELTYSAHAGEVLQWYFGAPAGQAFGFVAGSPAAVGLVMADTAVKAGDVEFLLLYGCRSLHQPYQRSNCRVYRRRQRSRERCAFGPDDWAGFAAKIGQRGQAGGRSVFGLTSSCFLLGEPTGKQ